MEEAAPRKSGLGFDLNKMIGNPTGDKVERFIQGGIILLSAVVYARNLLKDE
jgi:hypothetical protein